MKLCAHAISVGATNTPVIENLDFELTPGKILVVLGPNGSGKSTILKTIARQLKPLSGKLTLDDADISKLAPAEFARNVAYVAQNIDSKVHLSIQEYVALGRTPHQQWWQWQQSELDKTAVDLALKATALTSLRHRPLSQLSGGEQQRAAIAIALAQKPTFMLLDEPTAHLDFKHQSELLQLLRKLRAEQNLGLVVVLHDLSAAAYLADEVLLLTKNEGTGRSTAAVGKATALLKGDSLEQSFGVIFSTTEENGELHYFFNYGEK